MLAVGILLALLVHSHIVMLGMLMLLGILMLQGMLPLVLMGMLLLVLMGMLLQALMLQSMLMKRHILACLQMNQPPWYFLFRAPTEWNKKGLRM